MVYFVEEIFASTKYSDYNRRSYIIERINYVLVWNSWKSSRKVIILEEGFLKYDLMDQLKI